MPGFRLTVAYRHLRVPGVSSGTVFVALVIVSAVFSDINMPRSKSSLVPRTASTDVQNAVEVDTTVVVIKVIARRNA